MSVKIKVMGERNSGTNFLEQTLAQNFDVSVLPRAMRPTKVQQFILTRRGTPNFLKPYLRERFSDWRHKKVLGENGGWKHAVISQNLVDQFIQPKDFLLICSIRHPVSWARSMHENPFHAMGKVPASFDAFISSPWKTRARDGLNNETLPSPLVLWAEKVSSYLEFAANFDNIHVVRYEDLLLKTQETFARFSSFLQPARQEMALPEGRMRDFVLQELSIEAYREKARTVSFNNLSPSQRDVLESFISPDLIKRTAYL